MSKMRIEVGSASAREARSENVDTANNQTLSSHLDVGRQINQVGHGVEGLERFQKIAAGKSPRRPAPRPACAARDHRKRPW